MPGGPRARSFQLRRFAARGRPRHTSSSQFETGVRLQRQSAALQLSQNWQLSLRNRNFAFGAVAKTASKIFCTNDLHAAIPSSFGALLGNGVNIRGN